MRFAPPRRELLLWFYLVMLFYEFSLLNSFVIPVPFLSVDDIYVITRTLPKRLGDVTRQSVCSHVPKTFCVRLSDRL